MTTSRSQTRRAGLVSIIIPTYNRSSLVVEAVESCLAQTFPEIEVIVVDDGSSDDTAAVLKARYGGCPPSRFKYVVQENRGPAAARNNGLGVASGQYVKFLDSDDTLEPEAIDAFVRQFELTGADACVGARRYMSPEGRKWSVNYTPPAGLVTDALRKFFDLEIRPQQGIWMFRAALFDDGLAWNPVLMAREDTDLLGRMLAGGAKVAGAPEAILNQRYHAGPRQYGRQFEPDVFRLIHASNERILELMNREGATQDALQSFARSMCRTAVRAWVHDRAAARRCVGLAKKAHRRPELVLLPSYPERIRKAAYALWAVGGLSLCGPLMWLYVKTKRT